MICSGVLFQGERFGMVIYVPNKISGLKKIQEGLKRFNISAITSRLQPGEEVTVNMPKFKIESTLELSRPLQEVSPIKYHLLPFCTNKCKTEILKDCSGVSLVLRQCLALKRTLVGWRNRQTGLDFACPTWCRKHSLKLLKRVLRLGPLQVSVLNTSNYSLKH